MLTRSFAALTLALFAGTAIAQVDYDVTITNVTPGQTFTPQLVVTHPGNAVLFRLGEPGEAAPRAVLAID